MTVWNKYYYGGHGDKGTQGKPYKRPQYNNNTQLCRICGKPTENGDICKTCNAFIQYKKRKERRNV